MVWAQNITNKYQLKRKFNYFLPILSYLVPNNFFIKYSRYSLFHALFAAFFISLLMYQINHPLTLNIKTKILFLDRKSCAQKIRFKEEGNQEKAGSLNVA
ncbi:MULTISPECIES: hypothetical protein [Nitrosomonas]|uniref:Uncharacterized protein n=1 Tax=Nitrosomonas communis TaxID=44574 RepID=A0A0F7KEJ8_9PROT|nr:MULTISPECIES: hypothetical protein [Nitrosomonas]AKH37267.1 hypothetical protein AAW31_04755 [Nitrosomonas communis]UVS63508.1 hypothetical protein NX761_04950 [Nitrosomonas sp. PLL12]